MFIANPENHKRKACKMNGLINHTEFVGFRMKLKDTTSVNPWSFIEC